MSKCTQSKSTEVTTDKPAGTGFTRSIVSVGNPEPNACPHPVDAVEMIATNGLTTYARCERCGDAFVVWRS